MRHEPISVFVGGPFSAALKLSAHNVEFDSRLRSAFEGVYRHIRELGMRLMSAHVTESFGLEFDEATLVQRDNMWVSECDLYLALLPLDACGNPYRTDGTFMEAGLALALGKQILLVMEGRDHPGQSFYVKNTDRLPKVSIVGWDDFMKAPKAHLTRQVEIIVERTDLEGRPAQREQMTDPEELLSRHDLQTQPEEVNVKGVTLAVLPGVLSPKFSHSPDYMIEDWVIEKGAKVLDMGCGCGILGIFALLEGAASLTALDNNPQAVENTLLNFDRLGLSDRATAKVSDVYGVLADAERFDLILLSPPYWNRPASSSLGRACYDEDYQFLSRAVGGMRRHLKKDGRAYIIFSDQGDVSKLMRLIQDGGLYIDRMVIHRPSVPGGHCRIFFDLTLDE